VLKRRVVRDKNVKELMIDYPGKDEPLKNRLRQVLDSVNLDVQRALISTVAAELGIDGLTCAAALMYLSQPLENTPPPASLEDQKIPAIAVSMGIKMVRYRLDVGSRHQITADQLKKVLVEESGVDKNNINNINIQGLYTLIELPDEMPPDIFQHLKSVEINQHKLDIRRVKARNKKRGSNPMRRGRKRDSKAAGEASDPVGTKTVD
jgi:hypothetical protein